MNNLSDMTIREIESEIVLLEADEKHWEEQGRANAPWERARLDGLRAVLALRLLLGEVVSDAHKAFTDALDFPLPSAASTDASDGSWNVGDKVVTTFGTLVSANREMYRDGFADGRESVLRDWRRFNGYIIGDVKIMDSVC